MSHHKHSRDRERDRLFPTSGFYNKDYHSGDPHFTKRRLEVSRGGSKHYPTSSASYSNTRIFEDKKHHQGGHSSGSYHQSYPSSSSHHHRPHPYEKHSSSSGPVGGSGGSHHHHHGDHQHGHGSSSNSRYKPFEGSSGHTHNSSTYHPVTERAQRSKPVRVDFRKRYEKISSSSASGIRRIPPPLSPPPLMKITTSASSSRYRQAPPEDRHHHRPANRAEERSSRVILNSRKENARFTSDKKLRKPVDVDKPRGTKRSLGSAHEPDRRAIKKIKEENQNGEIDEKVVSSADTNGSKVDTKSIKEECINNNDEVKSEKTPPRKQGEEDAEVQKRPLLKLCCTYCNFRCVSFKDFSIHTRSFAHSKVMSSVIDENRAKVITLKHSIRDQQKELEKSLDEQNTLADTTSYCRVCEINLRTDPKEHEANEIHNEIKGLVDRKCEPCNVDFRMWKAYLFHTVALEHVKRVALKEMKEREGQKDSIPGSNMTTEDLGLDLLEQKHVVFCKACVRYFPIREDNYDESCKKHCMSLNHIKFVEDYTSRIKYIAKRDAEEKAKAETKRLARKAKEEAEKVAEAERIKVSEESIKTKDETTDDNEADGIVLKIENTDDLEEDLDTSKEDVKDSAKDLEGDVSQSNNQVEDSQEEVEEEEEVTQEQEEEDVDEDEIQLHADEDDEVDAPPREDE